MQTMSSTPSTSRLQQLADACVVCGLCLPHCPTYRKTGLEADGPRGRIQLMRAVLREELPASPRFHEHIDGCLACRSCEAVCPNHVHYGELLDGVRALHPVAQRQPHWYDRPLRLLARFPSSWTLMRHLLLPLQYLGGAPLLRRLGLARLPAGRIRARTLPGAQARVALFLGCVSRLADATALQAAVRLLNSCGVQVDIPAGQGCCGALALHQGEAELARQHAQRNALAFTGASQVLFTATGCGSSLLEQEQLGAPALPAMDVSSYLLRQCRDRLRLQPRPGVVWLHLPCSQRNVVRSSQDSEQLLRCIPQLELRMLPGNDQCCGAAGRYHLDQPQMATELRDDKIRAIRESGARVVVSSNIGCLLWLRAALPEVRLLHPLELLSEQLES